MLRSPGECCRNIRLIVAFAWKQRHLPVALFEDDVSLNDVSGRTDFFQSILA